MIFWEIILVIATVPIFRAFWMFLDNIDWLNEPAGIFVSFTAGLIAAIWALVRINSK
jgi:hypothetical protein